MAERVRLLIWDLDETFWRGVLSEGGVTFVERHEEIVVELARRGIVSSLCSKNDFAAVQTVLTERGVWDYFVAPSISWEAKGPRLAALIGAMGLRPASVMFIDDNRLNLEEARRFCPQIQVRGAERLAELLTDPVFAGKDDRELTRLKQYKLLEQRRGEQKEAGADVTQFLRDSQIEVVVETDVEAQIDRFVEIINRTNQLNFTKKRLSEDAETARAEARDILGGYQTQAALIRVRDKYGDHGICGAYVHNSEVRRLEHFAFSCRILGMGVERWLYQKLDRPAIAVEGEVLADLFDPAPVDWIKQSPLAQARGEEREAPRIGRITARGSCEIGAVVHYLRYHCDDTVGEYHIYRDKGVFRIGHSVFLYYGARGLTPAQNEAARRLGYVESDFATRVFDASTYDERGHLVILGFAADPNYPLIRHRGSGLIVPFTLSPPEWNGRVPTDIAEEETPANYPAWAREAVRFVRAEWDTLGLTKPQDLEALLRFTVTQIPASAKICLLTLLTRNFVDKDGVVRTPPPSWEAYNVAMRAVAASDSRVSVVELNDLLEDREIEDRLHYRRSALFKVYRRIAEQAFEPLAARRIAS